MLLRRFRPLLKCSLIACIAVNALVAVLPSLAFGQSIFDFSNQGSLDRNTPLRFKPVVGLEMGGIWLSRKAPDSQDFVFDGTGNTLLNADQLQGNMGCGLDATLSLFNLFGDSKAVDVQMRFFQASDMAAHETLTATSVIPVFYNSVPATPAASYNLDYESQIRSFEANLVARTPYRLRFLAGFRFFEVDEIFNVIDNTSSSSTTTLGSFSRSENTMAGGQIGAEGTLLSNGYSRLFGSFKWALLSNDVVGTASANDSSGNPVQADARDNIASQLLDFQIGSSLGLSRYFSLYTGYQGLVASDIALGLEQSRNASLFANNNPVFVSDSQWHGFKITGMFTW